MNWKKVIASLAIIVTVIYSFAYTHEMTHKYLYEYSGCEAKINYFPREVESIDSLAFMSVSADCSELSSEEYQRVESQQMMVEAVGYQLVPFLSLSLIVILILFNRPKRQIVLPDRDFHRRSLNEK